MSDWLVELVSRDATPKPDLSLFADFLPRSVNITSYITGMTWGHSVDAPYGQATVSARIPLRDLHLLALGYFTEDNVFRTHASSFLRITEKTLAGSIERFYGPVESVTNGIKVDGKSGARETAPITVKASTWITPLMRGFVVSNSKDLNVGKSIISIGDWSKIAEQVFSSAESGGLASSLADAWETLCSDLVGGEVLGATDYGESRQVSLGIPPPSLPVQGRNLSQLKVPVGRATLWGVLKSTFQASPLVEMFPTYVYYPLLDETKRFIVYRLRTPSPRYFKEQTTRAFLSEFGDKQTPTFYDTVSIYSEPKEQVDVLSYSLRYLDGRNNFIEVTSPYTGAGQLAGLSCDPALNKEDIEAYGLFSYSVPYPYIRADRDDGKSIREEVNEMVVHTALVHGMAHRYASGTLITKYVDAWDVSHGDWVRWRSYGSEDHLYEGYVTQIEHSITVNEKGVAEGRTEYTLERVEPIATGTRGT